MITNLRQRVLHLPVLLLAFGFGSGLAIESARHNRHISRDSAVFAIGKTTVNWLCHCRIAQFYGGLLVVWRSC